MGREGEGASGTYPSIARRAVVAVFLMLGYYALVLGIVAVLWGVAYHAVGAGHGGGAKLALFCGVAGAAVLWAAVPRPDRFIPPGPRLSRAEHPLLFGEIERVAEATGQAPPREVYASPDVNAWVAHRGGVMGFGSRPVMCLGLGLAAVLTKKQLLAVIAHEFGHYHGGDTKLGPWIFKTREAIERTVVTLGTGGGGVVMAPFIWYGRLFLKITAGISRQQEFTADRIAAMVEGSGALVGGLKATAGAGAAFSAFWRDSFVPILSSGHLPEMTRGFQRYIRDGSITPLVDHHVASEMAGRETNPYDSHPALPERVRAAERLGYARGEDDGAEALSMFGEIGRIESDVLRGIFGGDMDKLRPIRWDDVPEKVYLPSIFRLVGKNSGEMRGLTPADLPAIAVRPEIFGRRLRGMDGGSPEDDDAAAGLARDVVGGALTLLLSRRGGQISPCGRALVKVDAGGLQILPFEVLVDLHHGKLAPDEWRKNCEAAGIAAADLGEHAEEKRAEERNREKSSGERGKPVPCLSFGQGG